jgi:hypothetical protein
MIGVPRFAYEWPELAKVAAFLHAERERRYPALIAKGKIGRDEADADTRAMAAVADDWRRALAKLPAPAAPIATRWEKIAALTTAAHRYRARLARDPGNADLIEMVESIEALRWWTSRDPLGLQFLTDTTLALRAAARADTQREAA